MANSILSQKEILNLLLPALKSKGKVYKKIKPVYARPAITGEVIETITSDGKETQNVAEEGDFIIQNQTVAKEEYIISGDKFRARYELSDLDSKQEIGEYKKYKPTGKIIGLEVSDSFLSQHQLPDEFFFQASWGEDMIVKKGDYLVCPPNHSSIYRIAKKEFFETYQLVG